ncbi:MAG TPA: esterase-like activity of phytase family protein, partial [Chitinophagaceae bacterium]|nr:esterase-like activity of phytase family protein [Chitinophagaceae bacterium]
MRYNPVHDFFVRGSEGQRRIRPVQQLQNADIVIMDRNGNWMDSFALPPNMLMQPVEKGPRHNSVFEGLDFSENFQRLYVSVEEPLHEDGPKAGTGDSTSWVRIMEFDIPTRKQLAQFAYETDPVPHPANPPGAFKINGISDIMQVGEKKFIVIERAYSVGRVESDIRLFLA